MTNAEIIATIRNEIERLKGQLIRGACAAQIEMETNCKEEAYDEVLSFLSTIESKMTVSKYLEEAANEFANQDCVTFISRKKGFIAGAGWQAGQDKETIELAEDHAYLAGAVNEREKMLKEAVEGTVDSKYWGYKVIHPDTKQLNTLLESMSHGDKVRIIIVKE